MPKLIEKPTRIPVPGNKLIDEFIGRVNTQDSQLSVALMQSPAGWEEPGQRPEFDEYTLVIDGTIVVEHASGTLSVGAGQAVITHKGEWVRYKTPDGARYVAICLPAFGIDIVHRDA
jgi:ethanolamine utilization protein EutQ